MRCDGCGSRMVCFRERKEGNKVFLWYVCPRASCQQELLVVRARLAGENLLQEPSYSGPAAKPFLSRAIPGGHGAPQ